MITGFAVDGAPELVERQRDLDELELRLTEAAEGRGGILYVEGHAGIGKSRLLEEAARLGVERGFDVLRAQATELEAGFPLGILLQLFHDPARRTLLAKDDALFAGAAALAHPLLEGRALPAGDSQDLFRILHGLFWFVFNLAERRPVLICVDDAHLADGTSIGFIEYLAHRIGDLPVAAIVAARPSADGAAGDMLPRLRGHAATRLVRPLPLTASGVERLMSVAGLPAVDPEFVEACREASGGYPLHLREILLVLAEEGVDTTAANANRVREIGPTAVMDAIRLSLGRLHDEATDLARAVAILGHDVPVGQAAALARLDEATVVATAAALADTGIFRDDERLAFVHPVVRTAVYKDLYPPERAFAHGQAARHLSLDGGTPERIAGHLLLSDPIGEPWAFECLRQSGLLAAERGDPASAAALLERALDEAGEPRERAELQIALARAEAAIGRDTAAARIEEAAAVLEDGEERAEAFLLLGRLHLQSARHTEAIAAFDRGLAEPELSTHLTHELRSGRFGAALWAPGFDAEAEAIQIGSAGEPSTPGERVALANYASTLMLRAEDPASAVRFAELAWGDGALLAEAGPREPALFALTAAFFNSEEFDAAEAVAEAVLEAARADGDVLSLATAAFVRSTVHLGRGKLAEAAAEAEQALEARRYGWALYAPGAYWVLACSMLERGEIEEARAVLTLPDEEERSLSQSVEYTAIRLARGHVALAHGEFSLALSEFEHSRTAWEQLGIVNPVFYPWRPGAVAALLRLGDRDQARRLVDEQVLLAERYPVPRARADALRLRAAVADGREERALLLAEAAAELESSPALLERAHLLAELGSALLASGHAAEGLDRLRAALDLADRCGAAALADRARSELVAGGAKPRRARLSGIEALTPSELRVARLAATGRTNREIAEELFVTPKAVKWHLGNVYRKLDLSGREDLPDALAAG